MANIEDLELFVMISELDGLTPAARAMCITPAAASQALKRLESRLGVRLFNRTTRSITLTSEGLSYLKTAQHALKVLADGKRLLIDADGTIELCAPSDLGRNILLGLLAELRKEKRKLHINLTLSDRVEEFSKFKYNATLRFGEVTSLDLISLPILKKHSYIVCAAPLYLEKFGAPNVPLELVQHECLMARGVVDTECVWRFYSGGDVEEVQVNGYFKSDDGDIIRRWAIAGHGIANLPLLNVVGDILSGHLLPVLQGWEGESAPLSLVVSHRSQITDSLRLLQGALIRCCNDRLGPFNQRYKSSMGGPFEVPLALGMSPEVTSHRVICE